MYTPQMKKKRKRLLILIMTIPAIILPILLIIIGININKIAWWAVIGIPTVTIVSILLFLLAQSSAQRECDTSLQKKRKRILTVWGIYTFFIVVILIIQYYAMNQSFLPTLFIQTLFLISIFFIHFRVFFPKVKKSIEDDNQSNQEN
jgi:uncharacterized membrane protein